MRIIFCSPDILGGAPVFRGTRVPVDSLIDHLKAGDSLDEFLENFPSVTRDAAVGALVELATVERDADGLYVATVPGLAGCHTQAKDYEELWQRIREAIEACAGSGRP